MDSYSIIKKVENKKEDTYGFISFDRYIIVKQSSERFLLCSFTNRINEKLDSVTLFVEEFDQNGQIIESKEHVFNNCNVVDIAKFGENFKIKLNSKCEDVKVTVLQAEYSDYIRSYENGKVVVKYKSQTKNKYSEKDVCELTDGKEHLSSSYIKFNWARAIAISLMIVLIAFAGYFGYLKYFSATSETFVRNGCEYEFIENNGKVAISLVRYRGIGGRVVIPDHIEEYKVAQIKSNAFNGVWGVGEIEIQGNPILAENAFNNCYSLEKINLGKVESIAPKAFASCTKLKEIKSDYVTEVCEYAFDGCESLENIALNANEKIILHNNAFGNIKNLKSFSVASEIELVDSSVIFDGCENLQTLSLNTVSSEMGSLVQLFGKTVPTKLETITIENLSVIPDYLCMDLNSLKRFEIKNAEKIIVGEGSFSKCSLLSEFIVPLKVEGVGDYAFESTAITKFDGSNLQSMGNGAFARCSVLEEIILNEELTEISTDVFSSCAKLSKINFPKSCEYIGDNAFGNCNSLSNILLPDALLQIGNNAFENCLALSSIEFPSSLKVLGEKAFLGCDSLKTVFVPKTVEKIGEGVFANCVSLNELTLPYLGETLDLSGKFVHCFINTYGVPNSLKKVTILEGNLAERAFANCDDLEEIIIENGLRRVTNNAFSNCRSLKTVTFPDNLEEIGVEAFENCTSLESFSIPDSVILVEQGIFTGCTALKELSLPFMGSSSNSYDATNLGFYFSSFNNNETVPSSLKKVNVSGGAIADSAFSNCYNIEEINITNVEQIGVYAFYNCSSLKNVILPDNLTNIPQYAFGLCYSLTGLNLPNALESIGTYAFADCYKLKSISLPESLLKIGNASFDGCLHLYQVENNSKLRITKGEKGYGNVALNALIVTSNGETPEVVEYNDYKFLNCDNNWYLIDFDLSATTLTLPSVKDISSIIGQRYIIPKNLFYYPYNGISINNIDIGDYVSKIESSAFLGSTSLTSVTIGKNVESIGDFCFADSTNLKNIQFNNANALRTIGNSAFSSCVALENVSFDNFSFLESVGNNAFMDCVSLKNASFNDCTSLESIGSNAFYNCYSLLSVSFGNVSVLKNILEYAFYGCYNLKSFNAPQSLETIGRSAFSNCSSLQDVSLNSNLKSIDSSAFNSCSALKSIQIPDSITSISGYCFAGCSSLVEMVIPNSVTSIGDNAFADCYSLQTIKLSNNLTEINVNTFSNCTSLYSIDIPKGVTSIRYGAFQNCSSLELVYLPTTLDAIYSDAFLSCTSLYEIYNLSSLQLVKGERTYGDVAYYALLIHSDKSEPLMKKETINNIRFVGYDNEWYIVKYTGYDSTLTLKSFYGENIINNYAILDEVFANNYSINEIIIGKQVNSLGEGVFYNLPNLRKVTFDNSIITRLPNRTFSNCYALEEIVIPEGIVEIGDYAYNNCNTAKAITLPTSLVSIGESAFYNCYNIISVTIHNSLRTISANAFYNCKKLYEIYNLSSLNLVKGSTDYGYIAEHAIVIHTSFSETPIEYAQYSTFEFIKIEKIWYLLAVNNINNFCYLPKDVVTQDGKIIKEYTLRNGCFNYIYINDLVIPSSVTNIEQNVFSKIKLRRIYYEGNSEQWSNVSKNISTTGYDLYFYTNCVHNPNEWTYDNYGNVDKVVKNFVLISTVSPTCTALGTKTYRCPYCNEERIEQFGKLKEHNYDKNGVCVDCGHKDENVSTSAQSSSSTSKNKLRQFFGHALNEEKNKLLPNKVKRRFVNEL